MNRCPASRGHYAYRDLPLRNSDGQQLAAGTSRHYRQRFSADAHDDGHQTRTTTTRPPPDATTQPRTTSKRPRPLPILSTPQPVTPRTTPEPLRPLPVLTSNGPLLSLTLPTPPLTVTIRGRYRIYRPGPCRGLVRGRNQSDQFGDVVGVGDFGPSQAHHGFQGRFGSHRG